MIKDVLYAIAIAVTNGFDVRIFTMVKMQLKANEKEMRLMIHPESDD